MVVKAEEHDEEHGLVRRRVLYCSFGSFFTWSAPALSSSFPLGALWGAEYKIVLGHFLRPFLDFHYASSAIVLLGSGLGP